MSLLQGSLLAWFANLLSHRHCDIAKSGGLIQFKQSKTLAQLADHFAVGSILPWTLALLSSCRFAVSNTVTLDPMLVRHLRNDCC